MSEQKDDKIARVGPLHFIGPAVERDARVREDNDHEAVNLTEWMANIETQDQAMSDSEQEFFTTLRNRVQ